MSNTARPAQHTCTGRPKKTMIGSRTTVPQLQEVPRTLLQASRSRERQEYGLSFSLVPVMGLVHSINQYAALGSTSGALIW